MKFVHASVDDRSSGYVGIDAVSAPLHKWDLKDLKEFLVESNKFANVDNYQQIIDDMSLVASIIPLIENKYYREICKLESEIDQLNDRIEDLELN